MTMTREELIARAKSAVEAHKAAYYQNGEYRGADFWDFAEIFEIIEDLYEVTGDKALFSQFEEMYGFVERTYTENWEKNPFNDDIMWLVIAMTRAYLFTGEEKYLSMAKANFDMTFARAASNDLGGGLFWRTDNQCKNACVNCPGAVAASYLAKATGDASYWDKAAYSLNWAIEKLFEADTGKVYDSMRLNGQAWRWSSTYNQGTFIGSCIALWKHTGDGKYYRYAEAAMRYTMRDMYGCGVMDNEEIGNDQPGFKGILARYVRRFADEAGHPEALAWLRMNAEQAWNNRNSKGIMWTQLGHKTEEKDDYDVFAVSAAVGVVVNAVG